VVHVIVELLGQAHPHHALRRLDGEGRVGRDLVRDGEGLLHQQLVGHHPTHETLLEALGGG
jgi:hypothetical protein